jgi:hypothetical protein
LLLACPSSLQIGMHFMNPVPIMQLVELTKGMHTSQQVRPAAAINQLCTAAGWWLLQRPLCCRKHCRCCESRHEHGAAADI